MIRPLAFALALVALACGAPEAPARSPVSSERPAPAAEGRTAWVQIGDDLFELELAIEPATRFRGLSGRRNIAPDGGMLFVFERTKPLAMVMRDCHVPIDVAFLDETGRVVSMHAMPLEPPRGPDESPAEYEERLPVYASRRPARFAVETAGGRLAQLGLEVGDRLVFDAAALLRRVAGR